MKKVKKNQFKYHLYEPSLHIANPITVIFYHGWGTSADSYHDFAEELAHHGYRLIVPEIIFHDSRNRLETPFEKKTIQKYFWKTIFQSIDEFEEFFDGLGIEKEKTVIAGSSMGGFIANGIFAKQKKLRGLVNINGSGSFLLSENLFREKDNRSNIPVEQEMTLKSYDPIQYKSCDSPVLLIHGDSDEIVSIEGQKNYVKYLREKESRDNVSFIIYENINHQFTDNMIKDFISWLNTL